MTNERIEAAAQSEWDQCSDTAYKAMRLAMAYEMMNAANSDIASRFFEDWAETINSELSEFGMLENFVLDDFFPDVLKKETFFDRLLDIEAQCIQKSIENMEQGDA